MRRISRITGLAGAALVVLAAGQAASAAPVAARVSGTLNAVAAVSARDAWAVGATNSLHPLILHWNGTSWTRAALTSLSGQLFGVAAISARDAWAVGARDGGGTLIVHWNGTRWTRVASPAGHLLVAVAAWSARDVWAVGDTGGGGGTSGGALIVHWNGVTWKRVATPHARAGGLTSVAVTSARRAWAVGTGDGGPLILHWNGTRWTRTAGPALRGNLYGVTAPSARNAWAVGVGFGIRKSGCDEGCPLTLHWNGRSWLRQPSANPPSKPRGNWLFAVNATGHTAWAVGGTAVTDPGGGTLVLRLGRHRWQQVPSPLATGGTNLFGVAATSARNAWAVGYTTQSTPAVAVILRWTGSRWTRVL
jgi:hypothetical protein